MSAPATARTQPILWRHLWIWTLGALLVMWSILIMVAWSTGLREGKEFSDGQLASVAHIWLAAPAAGATTSEAIAVSDANNEYVQRIEVLAWADGQLVTDTRRLVGGLDITGLPENGYANVTVRVGAEVQDWRVYAAQTWHSGQQRRVVALMPLTRRHELGLDLAEHVATPAILLLPLVAFTQWWTIRRGLRPLERLSSEVAALDTAGGQRLDDRQRFCEFSSTVTAINTLVDTLQTRAQREREFASDVAHELRTPLSVIALHARAARDDASPARLARLEQEALRAGHILTQLLDLARAQRTGARGVSAGAAMPQRVVLGELAAQLISTHAQAAYDSGHELSLVQHETPVEITTPPMLLELALRNLIENALRHTPPGTQIAVEVWRSAEALGISVSDDGQRADAPRFQPPPGNGLGLGLRLVERMAEQMGAVLERDAGEPPMTTRFTLRWPR